MQSKLTDIALIEQTLAGNQSAYADLVKRHQRYIFTLAMRFSKNREDAEEIAQDCFIKAYNALGNFNRESKFSTWLYTIVYNTAMSFLRKRRMDTTSIDDEAAFILLKNESGALDQNLAENKSRSFYLNEAVNQLSADDAAIITMFYMGEQSLDEISKVMGMEANTVKVKLFRARQRLKERLEKNLKFEVKELI
jgi:RNA polymerase sigma-70 factor (ECF subfamily)